MCQLPLHHLCEHQQGLDCSLKRGSAGEGGGTEGQLLGAGAHPGSPGCLCGCKETKGCL